MRTDLLEAMSVVFNCFRDTGQRQFCEEFADTYFLKVTSLPKGASGIHTNRRAIIPITELLINNYLTDAQCGYFVTQEDQIRFKPKLLELLALTSIGIGYSLDIDAIAKVCRDVAQAQEAEVERGKLLRSLCEPPDKAVR